MAGAPRRGKHRSKRIIRRWKWLQTRAKAARMTNFPVETHPHPVPASERAKLLENPGFGKLFTDHMVTLRWSEDAGWHDGKVSARRPIEMDPATAVLHYAQEIFEGMKAYRLGDGGAALFRPEQNAQRFQRSARRLAMPELPEDIFLEAIETLVATDADWIPQGEGAALYLRPFMFASEVFLGVRPAKEYLFVVIASSVGAYFQGGAAPISLWVSSNYNRAGPGGTGAAKCGGNYAASLLPHGHALSKGCDQVCFLDAAEHKYIEELGGMNLFFVMDDGSLVTPPLTDTILAGITRDSIITLAQDAGHEVREERYSFAQWKADVESGRCVETFACGTAAVVTPVGQVKSEQGDFTIGAGKTAGEVTAKLHATLEAIQRGESNDAHGWVKRLG